MTMAAKGLAKLAEECGELVAVIGKKLAYYHTDEHPDGAGSLAYRLEDEIADVQASCLFVAGINGLDAERIAERTSDKLELFYKWQEDPTNNKNGIDRPAREGAK